MEEMLDTFDINGKFLGVNSREFCHSENPRVFHKTVWIWIVNSKGKILVQKRSKTKKVCPGKWDMPSAGHIDSGESVLSACVRETNEELGITLQEKDFIFLREFIDVKGWEIAQVYLLKKDIEIEDISLQAEEVECVKWLSYDDFVKLFYSNDFCNHDKKYKDWVCKILKNNIVK